MTLFFLNRIRETESEASKIKMFMLKGIKQKLFRFICYCFLYIILGYMRICIVVFLTHLYALVHILYPPTLAVRPYSPKISRACETLSGPGSCRALRSRS